MYKELGSMRFAYNYEKDVQGENPEQEEVPQKKEGLATRASQIAMAGVTSFSAMGGGQIIESANDAALAAYQNGHRIVEQIGEDDSEPVITVTEVASANVRSGEIYNASGDDVDQEKDEEKEAAFEDLEVMDFDEMDQVEQEGEDEVEPGATLVAEVNIGAESELELEGAKAEEFIRSVSVEIDEDLFRANFPNVTFINRTGSVSDANLTMDGKSEYFNIYPGIVKSIDFYQDNAGHTYEVFTIALNTTNGISYLKVRVNSVELPGHKNISERSPSQPGKIVTLGFESSNRTSSSDVESYCNGLAVDNDLCLHYFGNFANAPITASEVINRVNRGNNSEVDLTDSAIDMGAVTSGYMHVSESAKSLSYTINSSAIEGH